ncbi:MAG: hypothetical protein LBI45_05795 [Bacteroidales bacterium]|jgi:hypothetical protein|nr:hypothetical protein [Bacteroidales bacterium]
MKIYIFIIIFCIHATIYCQNTHEIIFIITDSVVVKKEYPKATIFNAEIIVQNLQDSLYLYYFNKYASPSHMISDLRRDFYKETTSRLSCVIEDKNNHIIFPTLTYPQFRKPKDEFKNAMSRTFVSSKQIFVRKQLDKNDVLDYDLAKYEISIKNQNLVLFPLLYEYNYIFSKGEYYLYFVYSFQETSENNIYPSSFSDNNRPDENKIFRGYFVSNKVKLIVE